MDKVYVVTSGKYDAYHIDCVFSTKEKAMEYVALHNITSNDYDIEEYELDSKKTDCDDYIFDFIFYVFDSDTIKLSDCTAIANYCKETSFEIRRSCLYAEHKSAKYIINMSILMRHGESIQQFKQRAMKIAIDGYFMCKSKGCLPVEIEDRKAVFPFNDYMDEIDEQQS